MKSVKIVKKPWGREVWYALGPSYLGKIIEINGGHRLSLQFHKIKHETIFTLKGKFLLQLGAKKKVMREGSTQVIPPNTVHRFEAPYGKVVLLEVSTPEVDDIVRLEDDYGRKVHDRRKKPR